MCFILELVKAGLNVERMSFHSCPEIENNFSNLIIIIIIITLAKGLPLLDKDLPQGPPNRSVLLHPDVSRSQNPKHIANIARFVFMYCVFNQILKL